VKRPVGPAGLVDADTSARAAGLPHAETQATTPRRTLARPRVLKLGGELIETTESRARIAALAAGVARDRPLVVIHGGGRAIDAELDRRRIVPKKIDGLRVTDAATLDAVIAVLAGSANTELVAAFVAAGVRAVGLTGVDAAFGRAHRATAHRTTAGAIVDLGLVGDPTQIDASLLELLVDDGYVPVIASLGTEETSPGIVLNVNADVMACRVAAALHADQLLIAGATAGVLDGNGRTIRVLDAGGIDSMIASGTATAGMVAKLLACRAALGDGVRSVRIVDGRSLGVDASEFDAPGTEIRN
jgi:acetylglutamate kinase